jgi:hypothetical protein
MRAYGPSWRNLSCSRALYGTACLKFRGVASFVAGSICWADGRGALSSITGATRLFLDSLARSYSATIRATGAIHLLLHRCSIRFVKQTGDNILFDFLARHIFLNSESNSLPDFGSNWMLATSLRCLRHPHGILTFSRGYISLKSRISKMSQQPVVISSEVLPASEARFEPQ